MREIITEAIDLLPEGRFHVGEHAIGALADHVTALAGSRSRVLLVTDRRLHENGVVDAPRNTLVNAGLTVIDWHELDGEPGADDIDAAARCARDAGAGCVVGIGGGSALDVAKLAAAVTGGQRPAADYALAAIELPAALPTVAVPTTAGTGSEATTTAVFRLADGHKVWAWGDALRPHRVILDPHLTRDLPAALTAATGADALVHAIEAYTGQRPTPESDRQALAAIGLIANYLPRAVATPHDIEARRAMLVAAALAGAAIDVGGTGVAHAIGHALGALGNVHHGRAVALALKAALPWNIASAPRRYTRIAEAMGIPRDGRDDVAWAKAAASAFATLLRNIGVVTTLGDHGLQRTDAERIANAAGWVENEPMLRNNVRRPDTQALFEICDTLLAEAG